jgi:hypothetical protein
MNQKAGRQMVYTQSESGTYPITIVLRGPWSDAPTRAGLTTMDSTQCIIQLNNIIFNPGMTGYIKPVVWHEMGHCAGLVHIADQKAIMYAQSNPFVFYSDDEITSFYQSWVSSAGF